MEITREISFGGLTGTLRRYVPTVKITPRINGWEVEQYGAQHVFTDFKELSKFLRTRCKALTEDIEE